MRKLLLATIPVLALFTLSAAAQEKSGAPKVSQETVSTFSSKCAMCHAKDASGNTAMGKNNNIRDLRSKEVQSLTDDQLFDVIAKGKGKMPPYEKSLGAAKIHELINYIRELAQKQGGAAAAKSKPASKVSASKS